MAIGDFNSDDFEWDDTLGWKLKRPLSDYLREMLPAEIEAQRQSWVRGMTARCEHGEVDFEQCPQCRAAVDQQSKQEG